MNGIPLSENITTYIIAYNEAETIARCINSFKAASDDFVVVLDDRTTDKTEQIAWGLGARVYPFHWIDDFSAARNYALDRCMHEWRMFADGDDVLDPESGDLIRQAVKYANEKGINSIISHYYTSEVNGKPLSDNAMTRLTRAGTMRWVGRIHEYQNNDKVHQIVTNIEVWHRKPASRTEGTNRNIGMLEKAIPVCSPTELPRYTFYYARELMFAHRYFEAIEWFDKYIKISTWEAEKHRALCDKAECFYVMGDRKKADEILFESILLNPKYPDPYVKRGIIAHELGNHDECVVQFGLAKARLANTHPLFSGGDLLPRLMTAYAGCE